MASVTMLFAASSSSITGYAQWQFDADTATFTVQLTGPGTNYVANLTGSGCDFTSLIEQSTYTVHLIPYNSAGVAGTTALAQFTTPPSGTGGGGTPPTRPANFSWTFTTVSSGSNCGMDHRDWNNLTSSIDAFRTYKGLGAFGFTTAPVGIFEAFYYRQAVNGINGMSPPISVPFLHYTGDDVTAADIDRLRISLNSIT